MNENQVNANTDYIESVSDVNFILGNENYFLLNIFIYCLIYLAPTFITAIY